MSGFDKRERAEEGKFALDQELRFKANARPGRGGSPGSPQAAAKAPATPWSAPRSRGSSTSSSAKVGIDTDDQQLFRQLDPRRRCSQSFNGVGRARHARAAGNDVPNER